MSWIRCMIVAPKSLESKITSDLDKNFKYKKIQENEEYVLVVYEGRDMAEFDNDKTFTLGVDGRNAVYYTSGNADLAEQFNAKIELSVGISLNLSAKNKLKSRAAKILQKLEEDFDASSEEEENEDLFNVCLSVSSDEAEKAIKLIDELTKILDKSSIPYRAAVFNGHYGEVRGDLAEEGLYIGPSAYALANWEQQVLRTETIELNLNGNETLLDGNSIAELS